MFAFSNPVSHLVSDLVSDVRSESDLLLFFEDTRHWGKIWPVPGYSITLNKTRLFLRKNKVVVFFLSVCWSCFIASFYFSMPFKQKSTECWVLGIECWVLNVGYTVIFPMPSQAKKYECWVLGIKCRVLNNLPWFSNTQSVKNTESTNFFPIPKIRGPTGKTALWFLVGNEMDYVLLEI